MPQIPIEGGRSIAPGEITVLEWLLDNAGIRDVSAYRIRPLSELRVVSRCDCGCVSLTFQSGGWGNAKIIADARAAYPDGQLAGIILWGRDGEIVLMEVHDYHPNSSHRVLEIANLRA
jgi:hypothetical protein